MIPPSTLFFISDVEGCWDRFVSLVDRARSVHWNAAQQLELAPDTGFVFGGDTVDRGPGGLRFLECLLVGAGRSPHFYWLAGNRDVNKLRLPFEVPGRGSDRVAALQHIFSKTMGAAGAFAHRQTELQQRGVPSDNEAVVDSFLEDVRPQGALYRYLERAKLAIRLGDVLFVHGAVSEASFLRVPGSSEVAPSIDRWIERLDDFYQDEWSLFRRGTLPEKLLAYQAPDRATPGRNDASIVYGRYEHPNGCPQAPAPSVRRKLHDEGIRWVVSGHTPPGDAPVLLREEGVSFVVGDSSQAVVFPEIEFSQGRLRVDAVVGHGNAGGPVAMRYDVGAKDSVHPIGTLTRDGALVRGVAEDGRWFVGRTTLPGYLLDQRLVAPET